MLDGGSAVIGTTDMKVAVLGLASVVAMSALALWYSHHAGYGSGYQKGHAEALSERNVAERERTSRVIEDNQMLMASNAYLSAQIESARQMLDERDARIRQADSDVRRKRGQLNDAVQKHRDWACVRVPVDITSGLRTTADRDAHSDAAAACDSQ